MEQKIGSSATSMASLTLLHAPCGYGKTTFARQIAHRALKAGTPVLWASAAGAETTLQFWGEMLRTADIPFKVRAGGRLGLEPLFRWAKKLTEPTILVVDDYQKVSSLDVDGAIIRLIEGSPNLRVIVAARRIYSLGNPLATRGFSVNVLRRQDLQFNHDETMELLAKYGMRSDCLADGILDDFGGWPLAGAVLARMSLEGSAPQLASQQLATDLERLVIEPIDRRVLYAIATSRGLYREPLSDEFEQSADQVHHSLQRLEDLGLVRPAYESSLARIVCLPAVAEAVLADPPDKWGWEDSAQLLRRSGRALSRSSPLDALKLFMEAGDLIEAEALAKRYFRSLLAGGVQALDILRAVNTDALSDHPTLLSLLLVLESATPSVPAATVKATAQLLRDHAEERALAAQGEDMTIAAGWLALAFRTMGSWEELQRVCADLTAFLDPERIEPAVGQWRSIPLVYASLSQSSLLLGNFEAAIKQASLGASAAEAQGDNAAIAHTRAIEAIARVMAGDVAAAHSALMESEAATASNPGMLTGPLVVDIDIAGLYLAAYTGDVDAGLSILSRLDGKTDNTTMWPVAVLAETHFYQRAYGAHFARLQLMSRLHNQADALDVAPAMRNALWAYAADLALATGDYDRARLLLEKLPPGSLHERIGRATLALFRGKYQMTKRLLQQRSSDSNTLGASARAKVLYALATWGLGDVEESLSVIADVANNLKSLGGAELVSILPYELLTEFANGVANSAGLSDPLDAASAVVTAAIDSLPATYRIPSHVELSPMELEALHSLVETGSASELAEMMLVSVNTVKFHLRNIYRKLGVTNRDDALDQAALKGYLRPS